MNLQINVICILISQILITRPYYEIKELIIHSESSRTKILKNRRITKGMVRLNTKRKTPSNIFKLAICRQ